jgi:uncharacterized protein (DUF1501 family)
MGMYQSPGIFDPALGSFFARRHLHRRAFFRHLGAAVGGCALWPALSPIASAQPQGPVADNVIFIYLRGGISQVDTFDYKEGSWTPTDFAPEVTGDIRWPKGLLPLLGDHVPSFTLVRSIMAWAEDHGLTRQWLQIGRNPTRADSNFSPHIGSVIASELAAAQPDSLFPAYVSLNAVAGSQPEGGFLPTPYSPLMVAEVDGLGPHWTQHPDGASRFQTRLQLLSKMTGVVNSHTASEISTNQSTAQRISNDARVNLAFQLTTDERKAYGDSTFGNACLVARNFLRHRLGPRFIQITSGDWDHHGQIYAPANINASEPTSMARRLDSGLGMLLADLASDGLLNRTLVLVMGEFGRTAGALSTGAGRDHLRLQTAMFAGASIRGGQAIGTTDATGGSIQEFGWRGDRPIRHEDIEATLYWALGIDWTKIIENPLTGGRYFYVPGSDQQEYMPLTELWAGGPSPLPRGRRR